MKKIFRFCFRLVFWLFLLLCSTIAAAFFFREKLLSDLRPHLEAAVSNAVGAKVTFGRSVLEIRHGLAVALYDSQIALPGECRAPQTIRKLSLLVDIQELLHKRIIVDELLFEGIRIRLQQNSGGGLEAVSEKNIDCATTAATSPNTSPLPSENSVTTDFSLQLEAVEFNDLDAEILLANGGVTLNGLHGKAKLVLTPEKPGLADFQFAGTLQKKQFSVVGKELSVVPIDKTVTLSEADIQLGTSKTRIDGTFRYGDTVNSADNVAALSSLQFDLEEITRLLSSLGLKSIPANLSGKAKGNLKVTFAKNISAKGDVTLTNFSFGKNLRALQAKLSRLQLDVQQSAIKKLIANAELQTVFVGSGPYEYSAQAVSGEVQYSANGAITFSSSKLSFSNFGFSDQETILSNIDAELKSLSFVKDAKGNVTANTQLSGTKLMLRHINPALGPNGADFEIQQIVSADAPLQLKIPSQAGYELSGTLNAKGVDLTWQGREFRNVSGSVKGLISSPLKRFQAAPLQFALDKESAQLNGIFEMTTTEFVLRNLKLAAFGGTTDADASLSKTLKGNARRDLKANLACREIDTARAIAFLWPAQTGSVVGTLKRANVQLSADFNNFKNSAVGSGSVEMVRGDIKTFDFSRAVGNAVSAIPGLSKQKNSAQKEGPEALAQSARFDFELQRGVVPIKNFELRRDAYTVRGSGKTNFEGDANFTARVTFLKENLGLIGSGLQVVTDPFGDVARLDIPINISGKLPDIAIGVDMPTFLKEKSGYSTAKSVVGKTGKVVQGVGSAVFSPLRRLTGSSSKEKTED